jgi:DNA-binding GntR family transcriptional regulator
MATAPRKSIGLGLTFSAEPERKKLTDWAYDELKEAILDLRLAPGTALREAALAEKLRISKTPIREALAWLERDGLVETTVFKGAVVTGYSRRDLLEIFELREILEAFAARDAATSMSDDVGAQFLSLSEASRDALASGSKKRLARLISDFDDILFDNVENQRIRVIIANLHDHLTRIGHLAEEIPGRFESSVEQHDAIIRAILARDPDAAEATMRAHVRSVRDSQLGMADTAPDLGDQDPVP